MFAIGVDIGGTSIKGAAISKDGVVGNVFSLPIDKKATQEEIVYQLIDAINNYIKEQGFNREDILGIGCGIPGVSDTRAGVVTYSNNLQWYELPIVEMIQKGTGLPVRITNDANAAALLETVSTLVVTNLRSNTLAGSIASISSNSSVAISNS